MTLILGLNGWFEGSHDAAAALIETDGNRCVIRAAVEEEKALGIKFARDRFPVTAIQEVLNIAEVSAPELDAIAFGWDYPRAYLDDSIPFPIEASELAEQVKIRLGLSGAHGASIHFVSHHLAHAASAFRTAGSIHRQSCVLVADGCGESESLTVWRPDADGGLKQINSRSWEPSLGFMFEAASMNLGFRNTDAGKTMGLAGYGEPEYAGDILEALRGDGRGSASFLRSCERFDRFYGSKSAPLRRKQTVTTGAWALLFEQVLKLESPVQPIASFSRASASQRNLASSVQRALEQVVTEILIEASSGLSPIDSLCIAGGVGLNCAMNGALAESFGIADVYVHPAAHDAGCAVGAALQLAYEMGEAWMVEDFTPFLGREYSDAEVVSACNQFPVDVRECEDASESIADIVGSGGVVGLFQGRNEWGPRALGARSIVARPADGMLDFINAGVKFREEGRPLGPSLLFDDQDLLWDRSEIAGAHMTIARKASGGQVEFPAIVHVDGTFRPQVVDATNQLFSRQLAAVRRQVGSSIVVNTSLNGRSPIVYQPTQALEFLCERSIDAMVFGNRLVVRRRP